MPTKHSRTALTRPRCHGRESFINRDTQGSRQEQTFGRSHRDYQTCPWVIPFGVGTKEEDVATVMLRNLNSVTGLKGGDRSGLRSLSELLGVEWLEPDVLTTEG